MQSMLPAERQKLILDILAEREFANVDALVEATKSSPATIRRDLQELADRGTVIRTRGGAGLANFSVGHEISYLARAGKQIAEKRAIAQLACSLVLEGQVIGVDVGSTTLEFAKALRRHRNLTVFTASLPIAQVLSQTEAAVAVVGGMLRKKELSVAGSIATSVLQQFHFDKFFLGTAGITVEEGLTDFSIEDVDVKKAFLARSKQVIALADHTKLGHVSFASICPLDKVHLLVTDSGADAEQLKALRDAGLQVLVAPL